MRTPVDIQSRTLDAARGVAPVRRAQVERLEIFDPRDAWRADRLYDRAVAFSLGALAGILGLWMVLK